LSVEDPAQAGALRAAMVRELHEQGAIRSEPVAAALATVPRHLFAPGEPLEAAYAPQGIVMAKRGPDGLAVSVMSAAHLQAVMLEQAGIEPGMRVLEVGSGGYNAALIQEITGESGQVTTVDIDADITDRARACLDAAGYDGVNVVLADAEGGVPEGAPYDRIIVTAAAWDIPPAWISQLTERGRLIVPLRMRGLTRSIAFDRDGDGLVSRDYCLARFVPVQGDGAYEERKVMLRDGIAIQTDDPDVRLDAGALGEALDSPGLECWSGAAWDLPDELELFLTASLPHVARLHASQAVIDQGIIAQSALMGVTALTVGDSFAYRVKRPDESTGGYESGVIAHGPQAGSLAGQYTDVLRRWARDYCRRGAALFRYLPGDAAPVPLPRGAIAKRHGVVTISWH
jgi:protein-L-isoaspartate(D-aspartate) O-methyltransferase